MHLGEMESVRGFCDTAQIWPSCHPTTMETLLPDAWREGSPCPIYTRLRSTPLASSFDAVLCLPRKTTAGGIEGTGAPCSSQKSSAVKKTLLNPTLTSPSTSLTHTVSLSFVAECITPPTVCWAHVCPGYRVSRAL